jgi:hypothetical protein
MAHQIAVQVQEAEGESQAVPPDVQPAEVCDDGIDAMNERAGHGQAGFYPASTTVRK